MKRILSLLLLSIISFACAYAHDIPEGKYNILGVRTQISGKQTPAKTVSDMYIKVKNNTIQFVSDGYTMYLVSISEPPMLIEDKKAYPCIDAKTGNKTLIVYYTEEIVKGVSSHNFCICHGQSYIDQFVCTEPTQ